MSLDTHQHFWQYTPERHRWIDDSMHVIQRDFMPVDLKPELDRHGIDGCIAVQVDQTEEETFFLLGLAEKHDFIRGVVGWVDLRNPDIEKRLALLAREEKLCGFRHIVQSEEDVNFLLRPDFLHGIHALKKHDFTYDILVFPHQLGAALEFARKTPDQKLVIDHIAKPYIKDGYMDGWAVLMREIARYPNVYCKISGIITESHWSQWTYEDIAPYLDVIFAAFGSDRLMYGSDWPVCLVAGTYSEVFNLIQRYTARLTPTEKANVFARNGMRFYGIR